MIGGGRLDRLDTATVLRRGVLALTGFVILGTAIELVFLRHWATTTALIVWPVMVALAVAFVAMLRWPSPRVVRVVRAVALVATAFAVVGVGFHVAENLDAGPLDRAFATTWDSMSAFDQWIAAITGAVGPAPTLAPGVLAQMGLGLVLATIRHPALVP